MDQPEFSAMLMKMTGECPAAENVTRQQNSLSVSQTDSFGPGVMPELALDFSLPFDDSDMSFDPPFLDPDMRAWCPDVQTANALMGSSSK